MTANEFAQALGRLINISAITCPMEQDDDGEYVSPDMEAPAERQTFYVTAPPARYRFDGKFPKRSLTSEIRGVPYSIQVDIADMRSLADYIIRLHPDLKAPRPIDLLFQAVELIGAASTLFSEGAKTEDSIALAAVVKQALDQLGENEALLMRMYEASPDSNNPG
jgi:hypothetical protein